MIVRVREYGGTRCDCWANAWVSEDRYYDHKANGACGDVPRNSDKGLLFLDEGDVYEIVPDEEVPDWVWAALMKEALTS